MKDIRYLVFAGEAYYAANGWYDFRGGCATLDEAYARVALCKAHEAFGWWQIVDLATLTLVEKGVFLRLAHDSAGYGDCTERDLAPWRDFLAQHTGGE